LGGISQTISEDDGGTNLFKERKRKGKGKHEERKRKGKAKEKKRKRAIFYTAAMLGISPLFPPY